jgi:transposase
MHSFPFSSRPYRQKAKNLKDWYLKDGLSASQIAERLNVSRTFVLARLHEMGIRSESGKDRLTRPENYLCNTPPYGWKIRNRKLISNKQELIICRYAVTLVRNGYSLRSVAKEITKLEFKNRRGKIHWDHSTIKSIYERWRDKL